MFTGTNVYIIGPGHMTKKAAMLIYGKKSLQIFFRTISQMTLKLCTQQKELEPYKVYINAYPGLSIYNKVNFVHLGFNI